MLQLHNSMARGVEVFRSREDGLVRMFTCGPSIYGRPHLGNYRTFSWEDVLQRYLEYLGYKVLRLMNMTDVEDKAIAEAEKEGTTVRNLTDRKAEQFFREARLLRIRLPEPLPRSSTSVEQAVKLIKILIEKGYAYWHGRDVFYDPTTFKGFGKLFGLDMKRWPMVKKRFRRDTYPGRRWNLGDFILWHGYKPGEKLFWETGIGKGRPSWNVQDPAMVTEHLGFTIDIACGGIDNLYRHHDYNIAVVEGVSGQEFSRFWLHGEHLLVNGKKMSKSIGNIVYPEDMQRQGYSGEHIRFCLIYGHYRRRINLTAQDFAKKAQRLDELRKAVWELCSVDHRERDASPSDDRPQEVIQSLIPRFEEHMNDDLNIKGAMDALYADLTRLVSFKKDGWLTPEDCLRAEKDLRRIDEVVQVLFPCDRTEGLQGVQTGRNNTNHTL